MSDRQLQADHLVERGRGEDVDLLPQPGGRPRTASHTGLSPTRRLCDRPQFLLGEAPPEGGSDGVVSPWPIRSTICSVLR